jgi:hypothetical protein
VPSVDKRGERVTKFVDSEQRIIGSKRKLGVGFQCSGCRISNDS